MKRWVTFAALACCASTLALGCSSDKSVSVAQSKASVVRSVEAACREVELANAGLKAKHDTSTLTLQAAESAASSPLGVKRNAARARVRGLLQANRGLPAVRAYLDDVAALERGRRIEHF